MGLLQSINGAPSIFATGNFGNSAGRMPAAQFLMPQNIPAEQPVAAPQGKTSIPTMGGGGGAPSIPGMSGAGAPAPGGDQNGLLAQILKLFSGGGGGSAAGGDAAAGAASSSGGMSLASLASLFA